MTREAIEYFEYYRKLFCEDYLKICPKDSIAYQATLKEKEFYDMAIKALEQEPCDDVISRKSIKQKLQEHHDFFVNAYGGYSNLPLNDKSRVDEITNCIAMVVNEPSVTPQEPRWIPVSERTPKHGGEYLLWGKICEDDDEEYCFLGDYYEFEEKFGIEKGNYDPHTLGFLDTEIDEYYSVIAWMPLPKGYGEVKRMTREEAKEFIAQSVKSDVDMALVADAIKALEQEPIIDKIRAKIEQSRYGLVNDGLDLALNIIDECVAESEE